MALRDTAVRTFPGSLIRDHWRLIRDSNTDTTEYAADLDVSQATLDAYAASPEANGFIAMGQADYIQILVGGTDAANETVFVTVAGLFPVADSDDVVQGWTELPLMQVTATLSTTTCGTVLSSLSTSIAATDLVADQYAVFPGRQLVDPVPSTPSMGPNYALNDAANLPGRAVVFVESAPYVRIVTDIGTAASSWVIGRRIHGKGSQATGLV